MRRPRVVARLEPERGGQRLEAAAERQRRAGEHDGLLGEQLLAQPRRRRRSARCAAAGRCGSRQPQHLGLELDRHALGDLPDVVDHAARLLPGGVGLHARPSPWGTPRGRRGPCRARAPAPRAAARRGSSMRPGSMRASTSDERVGRVGEVVDRRAGVDVRTGPAGRPLDHRRVELVGGRLGDAGGQLVGLVDDDGVVLGQHRHAVDRVDREQRVVGDDEVGVLGVLAGPLGEALQRVGAARRAEALAVVDADLPPGAVGVRRRGVAVADVAAGRPAPRPTRAARGPRRPSEPSGTSTSVPWSSGAPSRMRCRQA